MGAYNSYCRYVNNKILLVPKQSLGTRNKHPVSHCARQPGFVKLSVPLSFIRALDFYAFLLVLVQVLPQVAGALLLNGDILVPQLLRGLGTHI